MQIHRVRANPNPDSVPALKDDLEQHKTFESWAKEGEEIAQKSVYLDGELLKPREGSADEMIQGPGRLGPPAGRMIGTFLRMVQLIKKRQADPHWSTRGKAPGRGTNGSRGTWRRWVLKRSRWGERRLGFLSWREQ
jgi:hypothetical protein